MRIFYFLLIVILSGCTGHSLRHEDSAPVKVEYKGLMDLGGVKQYVEMSGESDANPVLLFIHGGPGWPQTPMLRYFNAPLTKSFTLVTWDQRGCGLSFLNDSLAPNLSLEQIVADAHELTLKLKKQFHQDKIYLVGYSWGSMVGLTLAQKYPGDYHAYAGASQVISIRKGIDLTLGWLTQQARAVKDDSTLKVVSRLTTHDTTLCRSDLDCFLVQYGLVSKYRGAIYNDTTEKLVEKVQGMYADYQAYDWGKGFVYSSTRLEHDMYNTDFSNLTKLDIPVYLLLGRHDWNVPAVLAESWLNKLEAPKKSVTWFEHSGHDALEEEAGLFNEVLTEKLLNKK